MKPTKKHSSDRLPALTVPSTSPSFSTQISAPPLPLQIELPKSSESLFCFIFPCDIYYPIICLFLIFITQYNLCKFKTHVYIDLFMIPRGIPKPKETEDSHQGTWRPENRNSDSGGREEKEYKTNKNIHTC